ncbi:MAG: serine hydrolase [Bacteroidota bacterium]
MNKHLSPIFLIISFLPLYLFAQSPAIPESIKANIRARIDNGENQNIIIGVIDEKGKHYYSYGYISGKTKIAPKKYTLYEIGSISKVFTSLALAQATIEEKCRIEDPLDAYLPEGLALNLYEGSPILLKHLSNHSSGLPVVPDNMPMADPGNPYADYDRDLMNEFLQSYQLTRSPENKFEYSNLAVGLLGELLADLEGISYEAMIAEKICKPLGMDNTTLSLNEDQKLRLSPGHKGSKEVANWELGSMAGAGGIRSTASDMLNFLIYQMSMQSSSLSKAMKLSQKGTFALNQSDSVALGWFIKQSADSKIIWHNGETGGYHSFLGFDKAKKRGIVVLANTAISIDDIGFHYLDPNLPLKEIKEVKKLGIESLDALVGVYELALGREIQVRRKDLQLSAQLTGQSPFEIYPESESRFFLRQVDAEIEFSKNEQGEIESLTLYQNGFEQLAKRTDKEVSELLEKVAIELPQSELKKFVGTYDLAPGIQFFVSQKEAQLYVKLTGQGSLPVYPLSKNRFFYKAVEAEIEFELSEKGEVLSLTLFQNGLENKAKKKRE